jgi:hypothetical protein
MQLCNYAIMQLCNYAIMQLCNYSTMQLCKTCYYAILVSMQLCNYSNKPSMKMGILKLRFLKSDGDILQAFTIRIKRKKLR